jgi:acetyltransferase
MTWGCWVSQNLLAYRNRGKVYLINPNDETVLGVKTFPSISAIPEELDFIVVIVPAEKVPNILEEAIDHKVKVATLITAGYAEAENGKKMQEELEKIVKKGRIRLQGPNCNGFFHLKR